MGRAFVRPPVLAALALLIVNDYWLKARWPGIITGKLSDIAGLSIFPLVLLALFELMRRVSGVRGWRSDRSDLLLVVVVTCVAFSIVKTSASVAHAYSTLMSLLQWPARALISMVSGAAGPGRSLVTVRADVTDLVALPALLLAYRQGMTVIKLY